MSDKKSPPVKKEVTVVFDPEPVRLKTGLKKGEFAALIRMSKNGYSKLSSQPTQVRVVTLANIISATNCSISDLYRVEPSDPVSR